MGRFKGPQITGLKIVQGLFSQRGTNGNSFHRPLVVALVTTEEVLENCSSLGDNKATGLDGIPKKPLSWRCLQHAWWVGSFLRYGNANC